MIIPCLWGISKLNKYDSPNTPMNREKTEKELEEQRKIKERREAWEKKSDFEKQNELPF